MENYNLESLPDIERLSSCVTRVLGQNPGKFTLQGTNTYLLGDQRPYILIDTGDGNDAYTPVLKNALVELASRSSGTDTTDIPSQIAQPQPHVSDVVITHAHPDHYGGLLNVLTLLRDLDQEIQSQPLPRPRIHKLLPHYTPSPLSDLLEVIPSSLYTAPDGDGEVRAGTVNGVLHALSAEQKLRAPGVELEVVSTPGHTIDSVCMVVRGTGQSNKLSIEDRESSILTADTVLGQGTAVFEDLTPYMASLEHLRKICSEDLESGKGGLRLLPGHGPVVPREKSLEHVEGYIEHRKAREREILAALRTKPPSGPTPPPPKSSQTDTTPSTNSSIHHPPYIWSIGHLVRTIYSAAPENLWMAAAGGVWLCLKKLEGEERVKEVKDDEEDRNGDSGGSSGGSDGRSGGEDVGARRSEADRKGEKVWKSRWCLVESGSHGPGGNGKL